MTNESKRKILVGFLQPDNLEKDIIYVQLTKFNGSPNSVRAFAVSNEEFNYIVYPSVNKFSVIKSAKSASNKGNDFSDYTPFPYKEFLKVLEKENNAETEYRFEDGLILTEKLGKMKEKTNELEKSLIATLNNFNSNNF